MSKPLKPYMGVLPDAQRALWNQFDRVRELGYVLYGGTAIALRLGHRTSVDFDFFSDGCLDRSAIISRLPVMESAVTLQDEPDVLTVLVNPEAASSGVKLSFFGSIGFGRVGQPEVTEDNVLLVASLEDLLATKMKTVLQRAEAKDYRDIAEMLRSGLDLAAALGGARTLFGLSFQPSESLRALTFFEDGDLHQLDNRDRSTLVTLAAAVAELPVVQLQSDSLL